MEAQENNNLPNDEISLKELILKLQEWWKFLLSKWVIILIAGVIGGILGLTFAIFKKPVYTAETTFVLEEGESGGGLGQYAGLASMVGIDLGGGGGGVFEGDNILELYKSRRMIEKTLLTKDIFYNKEILLIDKYIEFNNLKSKWKGNPILLNLNFNIPKSKFSLQHDSLLNSFVEIINKKYLLVTKPDKKLSIIKVSFENKDELFAKSFTDNIVKNVNQFYVETKTKNSKENLSILQFQTDSIKNLLNSNIGSLASSLDANPNINSAFQSLRVPTQRKQIDVQANGAIYQELVKNLEMAKVSFRKDNPLIQIIDYPILPLKEKKTTIFFAIFLGAFLFGILMVFYLTFVRILQ
jgi:hypothetical protein